MIYKHSIELLENIQVTRRDMVQMGMLYGLTHPTTLKLSRKLDGFLNDLYKPENRHLILLMGNQIH